MSEKRFKLNDKGSFILEDGEPLKPLGNVVHKLNDLHEERNYFEKKKCEYWNKFNLAHLDNINLQEENDILKQKLRKNYIANKQYEELKRLQEENEKLRQDRNVANDFIVKKGLDIEYYKYWRGLRDE